MVVKAVICSFLLLSSLLLVRAESTAQQNYFSAYLVINEAQHCEMQNNFLGASARYQVVREFLEAMRTKYPYWETQLLAKRIKDCSDKQRELKNRTSEQILTRMKATLTSSPDLNSFWIYAEDYRAKGKNWEALTSYQEFLISLQVMHEANPQWESTEIEAKMAETKRKIDDLQEAELGADAARRARQNGSTDQ